MLLSQLAEAGGVAPATIKYYRRVGLLPPGRRVTATQQDYGQEHLDRLALIRVLREVADAPIARIAELTAILDDPEQSLLAALGAAQHIALGIPGPQPIGGPGDGAGEDGAAGERDTAPPPDEAAVARTEHPSLGPLLAELGWPDETSAPRRALDELLRSFDEWGMPTDLRMLRRYAGPVAQIAREDVAAIRDLGGERNAGPVPAEPVPADVQVMRSVAGSIAFDRLIQLLRALGHTSYSILHAREDAARADGG